MPVVVLVGLLLFALLRLYFLDASSLWYDELHTAVATGPEVGWQAFWQRWLIPDVHPPLFYLLVWTGQQLGMNTDFLLRLWPFLFSVLLIPVAWCLQRKKMSDSNFSLYLLLLAASPFVVYYGAELRSYALLYLLAALATAFYHRIISNNDQLPASIDVIGLAVSCGLLALTHYFSFFFIAGCYLTLIGRYCQAKQAIFRVLLPAVLAGLPSIAWFYFHSQSLSSRAGGNFWISNDLAGFFVFFVLQFATGVIGALVILFGMVLALVTKKNQAGSLLLRPVLWGLLLAVVVSLHTPMLTPRNLLVFTPLVLLWLAIGFDNQSSGKSAWIAKVLIMGLIMQSALVLVAQSGLIKKMPVFLAVQKQDWRAATQFVESISPKQCPIPYEHKFDPYMRINTKVLYQYYFKPENRARLVKGPLDQQGCPVLMMAGQSDWNRLEKNMQKFADYQKKDFNFVRVYYKP